MVVGVEYVEVHQTTINTYHHYHIGHSTTYTISSTLFYYLTSLSYVLDSTPRSSVSGKNKKEEIKIYLVEN